MISTGESGINPISREQYFEECLPDVVVSTFCSYFGVSEPKLKKNPAPTNGRYRGCYYYKTEVLTYNREYTGIIMHELAHHIAHKLYKDGAGHGQKFSAVLQEMHDYWR